MRATVPRLRRATLASVPLVLTATGAGSPAMALAGSAPGPDDRAERVAEGLADSRLFVDPEVRHLVTEGEVAATEEAIASAEYPVFVLAHPVSLFDTAHGDAEHYLYSVYEELGEPGVYLLARPPEAGTRAGFSYAAAAFVAEVGVDPWLDTDRSEEEPAHGELLLTPTVEALDGLTAAPEELVDVPAPPDPPPAPAADSTSGADSGNGPAENDGGGERILVSGLGGLVVGVLGGLMLLAALRALSRLLPRARRERPDGRVLPSLLHARQAPREPSVAWLRKTLAREQRRLRHTHQRRTPGEPGFTETATALDAVTLIHGESESHHAHWLVGAIVLARVTRATPESPGVVRGERIAPCMVNPLHGVAVPGAEPTKVTRTGPLGKVCAQCVGDTPREREFQVLRLPDVHDPGQRVPHHRLPGPWARTQYGALDGALARTVVEKLDAR